MHAIPFRRAGAQYDRSEIGLGRREFRRIGSDERVLRSARDNLERNTVPKARRAMEVAERLFEAGIEAPRQRIDQERAEAFEIERRAADSCALLRHDSGHGQFGRPTALISAPIAAESCATRSAKAGPSR